MKIIRSWAVTVRPGAAFTAPECRGNPSVGGLLESGTKICTSPIEEIEGRVVRTKYSTYVLEGDPDPFFMEFLMRKGLTYNDEEPFQALVEGGFIHL